MALIDKASLLMVPSTYEAGKLYNVLPSGNRAPDSTDKNSGYDQTRADFDFDRGSNAAATRIGSDGLLKKYRENLLLQSNQFDTTWANSSSSETDGQGGYDGTNNAWLLSKTAAGGRINQSVSLSGVQTLSMYAKAGTLNWMRFITIGGTTSSTYYDLENGVIGANISSIDTNIESVGNGWYRCSVTTNQPLTEIRIYPADADNDTSGTTGSIYIQNAQVETGLVATDYLNSTDVTGKAGVLIDLPRINYDANGENGALLLEPSRQNLVQYSEYINNTDWNHQGVNSSVNTSETKSPEGFYNAVKLEATNTDPYIFKSISVSTGDNTFSFYIKGTGSSVGKTGRILFWYIGTATGAQTSHDFTLTNEWQRVDATTSVTGAGTLTFRIDIPADAAISGEVCYLYGLQLEAGSYPSSYIPNHGTSGGVTRAADSCSVTGASDVIGQTEGTLFVEAETLENGADCRITLSDNTISNRVSIEWDANADTIKGFIGLSGNLATTSYDQTNRNKIAIVYNSSDARFFVNGVKVDTDTTVSSLSGMNRIDFSNYGAALPFVGKVYKMYVSEEKLTDAEAITLTTL